MFRLFDKRFVFGDCRLRKASSTEDNNIISSLVDRSTLSNGEIDMLDSMLELSSDDGEPVIYFIKDGNEIVVFFVFVVVEDDNNTTLVISPYSNTLNRRVLRKAKQIGALLMDTILEREKSGIFSVSFMFFKNNKFSCRAATLFNKPANNYDAITYSDDISTVLITAPVNVINRKAQVRLYSCETSEDKDACASFLKKQGSVLLTSLKDRMGCLPYNVDIERV